MIRTSAPRSTAKLSRSVSWICVWYERGSRKLLSVLESDNSTQFVATVDGVAHLLQSNDTLYLAIGDRIAWGPAGGGPFTDLATPSSQIVSMAFGDALDRLFFVASDGSVRSVLVSGIGSGPSSQVTHATGEDNAVAVAEGGAFVYWARRQTPTANAAIRRVRVSGGSPETFIADICEPTSLVVVGAAAHWGCEDGRVMRAGL